MPVDVLRRIQRVADRRQVDVVVIGAVARDLVAHLVTGGEVVRATKDVDVAVTVSSQESWQAFREDLGTPARSEHRVVVLGCPVDVVPHGPVAQGDVMTFADGAQLDINGLPEAASSAVDVRVADDLVVRVASVPAQLVLKLLAWRDRGWGTTKDARDLGALLMAAGAGCYEEEAWQDETALEWAGYDIRRACAFRVGRLAAEPCGPALRHEVLRVLSTGGPRLEPEVRAVVGPLASEVLQAVEAGFSSV